MRRGVWQGPNCTIFPYSRNEDGGHPCLSFWGPGHDEHCDSNLSLVGGNEIMPCGFAVLDVLDNAPSSAHQLNKEGRLAEIELPSRYEDDAPYKPSPFGAWA